MVKWRVLISVYFVCVSPALAQTTAHMEQMCGGTIPSQDRYRQVTFRYDSSNITHRDCKVRVNPGALKLRDGGMMYSKTGFLIVFQEVNLFNLDCGQANLSVTKGIYYYGSDYDYIDNLPNPNIPGIPRPLCTRYIPWSEYPTRVIEAESYNLDIWFQAGPNTPDGAGFKLLIVDYYDGSFRCQEGEYRCKNKRCFTKSAENCGGIDWCTDNSGCNVNWGLVGGLIGGIGSALIGLGIGLCLSCYIKRKRNQSIQTYTPRTNYRTTITPSRIPVRNTHTRSWESTPDRTALRYPGSTAPNHTTSSLRPGQRQPSPAMEPVQESPHSVPSGEQEPPSYNSIWEPGANTTDTALSIRTPAARASTSPAAHQPSVVRDIDSSAGESYQPPPPDYDVAIQYRELYKVTESQPTIV